MGVNPFADNMTNNTPYGVDVVVRLIIVMPVTGEWKEVVINPAPLLKFESDML